VVIMVVIAVIVVMVVTAAFLALTFAMVLVFVFVFVSTMLLTRPESLINYLNNSILDNPILIYDYGIIEQRVRPIEVRHKPRPAKGKILFPIFKGWSIAEEIVLDDVVVQEFL